MCVCLNVMILVVWGVLICKFTIQYLEVRCSLFSSFKCFVKIFLMPILFENIWESRIWRITFSFIIPFIRTLVAIWGNVKLLSSTKAENTKQTFLVYYTFCLSEQTLTNYGSRGWEETWHNLFEFKYDRF